MPQSYAKRALHRTVFGPLKNANCNTSLLFALSETMDREMSCQKCNRGSNETMRHANNTMIYVCRYMLHSFITIDVSSRLFSEIKSIL